MSKDRGLEIGRIVLGATVTWMTWKILQAMVGHRIDTHIVTHAERRTASLTQDPQPPVAASTTPVKGFELIRR